MATETRRRTNAAYAERRLAAGWAKVMVWLSPEAVAALPALVKEHGSRDAAINARLTMEDLDGPPAPAAPAPAENPAPPASVTRGGKREAKRNDPKPLTPVPPTVPAETLGKGPQRAPARLSVDVPYAKDVVRKPYQKGQTKGSKR